MPDGKQRWFDEFSNPYPHIVQLDHMDPTFMRKKALRDALYMRWQQGFFERSPTGDKVPYFKPRQLKWQAIRILRFQHSEKSDRDWWEHYQDAVFRVFVNPHTHYDSNSREHKQWYLLSPEDGYLVNRYELERNGNNVPPRQYNVNEEFFSADPRLRMARFVPVECCHHLRHETTGGELPEGL